MSTTQQNAHRQLITDEMLRWRPDHLSMFLVLAAFAAEGEHSPRGRDIARRAGITPGGAQKRLMTMEAEGIIDRIQWSDASGRRVQFVLNVPGYELVPRDLEPAEVG